MFNNIILSNNAKDLLVEASKDKYGAILLSEYQGGSSITTNGRDFIEKSKDSKINLARVYANWKAALKELLDNELIEKADKVSFIITKLGFDVVDDLFKNRDL